jgi:hypothetical protein
VTADENATGIDDGLKAALVNSHVDNNSTYGVYVDIGATMTMKNSTANDNNLSAPNDVFTVSEGGHLYLFNNNTIGVLTLSPASTGYTDGTNNISTVGPGTLTKANPQ